METVPARLRTFPARERCPANEPPLGTPDGAVSTSPATLTATCPDSTGPPPFLARGWSEVRTVTV